MTAIPFSFNEESHVYEVEGHYCLATSDVIAFNGLCDYGAVPIRTLEHARWRGEELHKCIDYFENGELDFDTIPDEVMPYFQAYCKFREQMSFEPISMEHLIVYQHTGTEQMVGCKIDLRGLVRGRLYIVDPKCTFPNSGQAKKQTHLRWRMQLESYNQATQADEKFWEGLSETTEPAGRAILHLKKDGSFDEARDFIDFSAVDDEANWDSCVRLAQLKLANGYKKPEK